MTRAAGKSQSAAGDGQPTARVGNDVGVLFGVVPLGLIGHLFDASGCVYSSASNFDAFHLQHLVLARGGHRCRHFRLH